MVFGKWPFGNPGDVQGGATGTVFLVHLWIYYEAQIILVGAEFTRVLARRGIDGLWASSVDDDGQPAALPGDDAALDVGG